MSLSKLQKAAAFAGLAAAPATAHAGVSNVTAAVKMDNHTKKGQSDARGDEKFATISLRTDDGKVFSIETGIYTPQYGQARASRDTATITATYGREMEQDNRMIGLYGSAGLINGPVLDQWHSFVKQRHGGFARTSPGSSKGRVVAAVAGRVDQEEPLLTIGSAKLDLDTAVFGIAGTHRIAGGVGAFISLNGGGENARFRPSLPDMPVQPLKAAYSIYAGVIASARIYDVATEKLGTELYKASAVAGAAAHFGRLSAGIEFQKDLTPEIERRNNMPVGRTMVKVGFDF